MKLLFDTHALLWLLTNSPELSGLALDAIVNGRNEKLFSIASLWEISIKVNLGKLPLGHPLEELFAMVERSSALRQLPIHSKHLLTLAQLPLYHRDPFDRLIVAQAISEGCTLVSRDGKLDAYGVQRLW